MNHLDHILTTIASEYLDIATLETRRSDRLDFHDVGVWQIRMALKTAFEAGARSVAQNAEPPPNGASESDLTDPTPPLLIPSGTTLLPGKMYLRLYHGRTDPDQVMDDWGFDGPTFGPLVCYVHTYCGTFRIHGESDSHEIWLEKHDDMIHWDACFYGDMEVFIARGDERA